MENPNNQSTTNNPVGRFMVAVGAVIEYKNTKKILLLKRSDTLDWQPGEWEVPYGRMDQFEMPETALAREVLEETGLLHIDCIDLLSVWHIYRGIKSAENELVGFTYYCKTNTEKIRLSEEHSSYKWITPNRALTLVKDRGIRSDVEKYIKMILK